MTDEVDNKLAWQIARSAVEDIETGINPYFVDIPELMCQIDESTMSISMVQQIFDYVEMLIDDIMCNLDYPPEDDELPGGFNLPRSRLKTSKENVFSAGVHYFTKVLEKPLEGKDISAVERLCTMGMRQHWGDKYMHQAYRILKERAEHSIEDARIQHKNRMETGYYEERARDERAKVELSSVPPLADDDRSVTAKRDLTTFQTILMLYCTYRSINQNGQGYELESKKFKPWAARISGISENSIHKMIATQSDKAEAASKGLITRWIVNADAWETDKHFVQVALRAVGIKSDEWIKEIEDGKLFGEIRLKEN